MGILQSSISAQLKKMKTSLTAPKMKSMATWPMSQPSVNIQSLPQELLLHVFSFLSATELLETVSKVCTHWYVLHQDPRLYTAFEFKECVESTQTVINLLRQAPWLKALTLVDRSDIDIILQEVYRHNPQIRVLVMKNIYGSFRLNASLMKKITQHCRELHTLTLHGWYVRGEVFYKNLGAQLPQLKAVHFLNGGKFSSKALLQIVNSSGLNLEDIRIYNNYKPVSSYMDLSDAEITTLCERFCNTLLTLKVDYGGWSRDAFSALKKCYRLENLGIFEAHDMCYTGLLYIGLMSSLRHLEITCCSVPEMTWMQLITSAGLRNLESLILSRCNISDKVAIAIGRNLKKLKVVGLTGHLAGRNQAAKSVSARGVMSLIMGCHRLHTIELFYMDHTVQDVILLIPKYLPRLKRLFILQKGNLQWETVTKIKATMPELLVEYMR